MGSCSCSFSKLALFQSNVLNNRKSTLVNKYKDEFSTTASNGAGCGSGVDSNSDDGDSIDTTCVITNMLNTMKDSKNKVVNKKLSSSINRFLPIIRSLIMRNNQENPYEILKLKQIVKDEELWLMIIFNLIDKIEMDDQLGPSIIAIFLEETPLPSLDQVSMLIEKVAIDERVYTEKIQRNLLIIWNCLSLKVAGTNIAHFLAEKNINFTLRCLNNGLVLDHENVNPNNKAKLSVLLFVLIALEKFSISSAQNKQFIMKKLNENKNPLLYLSEWRTSKLNLHRQIGFLAQYLLDNTFTPENHVYGCSKVKNENVNVRLNDEDASENLKLSPDGLEARNDTLSFESIRSTTKVKEDVWYYEVTLYTSGIMQIGFATKSSNYLNHQGFGVGDDEFSVSFDGCRNLIWHKASYQKIDSRPAWKEGDVIGFLLDFNNKEIRFYVNGKLVTPIHTEIFEITNDEIYPAASFMTFQHAVFNFGSEPFKFAPLNYDFKNFNSLGSLSEDKKIVLPKRKRLEILKQIKIKDDACTLCYENDSIIILIPCKHKNFCESCVKRLNKCPICRSNIESWEVFKEEMD